jgi:hypothetical protein
MSFLEGYAEIDPSQPQRCSSRFSGNLKGVIRCGLAGGKMTEPSPLRSMCRRHGNARGEEAYSDHGHSLLVGGDEGLAAQPGTVVCDQAIGGRIASATRRHA